MMDIVSSDQIKNPIIRELIDWYSGASENGDMPARTSFRPAQFSGDLMRRLFLTEVTHDPFRVRYRVAGDLVEESFGYLVSGKFIDDLPIPQRDELLAWYKSLIGQTQSVFSSAIYSVDGQSLPYEGALLPLASGKDGLSLFVGAEFFADIPAWRASVRERSYGAPQDPAD